MASLSLFRRTSIFPSLRRCFATAVDTSLMKTPAAATPLEDAEAAPSEAAEFAALFSNDSAVVVAPPSTPIDPNAPIPPPSNIPPPPSKILSLKEIGKNFPRVPPYPFGVSRIYKQSNRGLYGGSIVQFGNKVSEKNEIKTRRRWDPNLQHKKIWSKYLQQWFDVRLTNRVARTIKKVGGLDEYVLGDKAQRIKELGVYGWTLRWWVMIKKKEWEKSEKARIKWEAENAELERKRLEEEAKLMKEMEAMESMGRLEAPLDLKKKDKPTKSSSKPEKPEKPWKPRTQDIEEEDGYGSNRLYV